MATATYTLETRTQVLAPTYVRRSARWGSASSTTALPSSSYIGAQSESSSSSSSGSGAVISRGRMGNGSTTRVHVEASGRQTFAPSSSLSNTATASTTVGTPMVEAAVAGDDAEEQRAAGLLPDNTTMNMLHCLFAMAFAALTLGGLTFSGVLVKTSSNICPAEAGYSGCAAWQDFRSLGSFVLGALLCCLLSHGKESNIAQVAMADRAEKIQLYAYML